LAAAAAAAAAGATPPEAMATEPAGTLSEELPFLLPFSPRVTSVQPSPEAARAAAAAASSASLSKSPTQRSSRAESAAFPGRKRFLWDSTHSLSPCGESAAAASPPPAPAPSSPAPAPSFDFLVFFFLSAFFVEEERGGRCSVAAERAAAALARVCRAFGEENETMAEHCAVV